MYMCLFFKRFNKKFVGYFSSPYCLLKQIYMKTNFLIKQLLPLVFFLIATNLLSQTVTPFLDPSLKFVKTMNSFHLIAERTDGKVWFTADKSKLKLELLNQDGTLNEFSLELQGNINALTPVTENKILVGGNFTSYNGTTVSARLVRVNPDGTRDFGFSASANANEVTALYVLPNGKVMVGRNTQIQRFNEDGSTDSSFATVTTNGKVFDFVMANNNVIAVGDFTTANGSNRNRIVSLQSDGTLDTAFNIDTGFNASANSIRKSSDNKFYVIGNFISYKGITVNRIAKIDLNGNLDTVFHNANTGFNVAPSTIAITQSNKLMIGGAFTQYNNQSAEDFIVINTTNGVPENNSGYVIESGIVKHIIPRTNGGFIFSGEFVKYNNDFTYQMFKTNDDINKIPSFQFGSDFSLHSFVEVISPDLATNFTGNPIKIKRQNDKILLSEVYINNKRHSLARFTNTGLLDNTFLFNHSNLNLPSNLKYTFIRDFSLTPSGNIFLFLTNKKFNTGGTEYAASFLQLTANGTMDDTFFGLQDYFKLGYPNLLSYHLENTGYVRDDNKIIWAQQVVENVSGFEWYPGTYKEIRFFNHLNLLKTDGDVEESFQSVVLNYNTDSQQNCNTNYYHTFFNARLLPLPNNETLAYLPGRESYCSFDQINANGSEGVRKATIGRINANGVLTTRYTHLDALTVSHVTYQDGYLYAGGYINNNLGFFKKIDLATNNEVPFNHQLPLTGSGEWGATTPLVIRSFIKDNKIYVLVATEVEDISGGYMISYDLRRMSMDGILDTSFQTLNIVRHKSYTELNSTYYAYFEELEFIDNPNEDSFLLISRFPFTINGTYYEQAFVKVDFTNLSISDTQKGDNKIFIYPNPMTDFIVVQKNNDSSDNFDYKVYDLTARVVFKGSSTFNEKIDTESLIKGNYIIQVETENGEKKSLKMVKN